MATTVATLIAMLGVDHTGLKTGLSKADKEVRSFGQKSQAGFQKFGKAAVVAGAAAGVAVAAFGAKAVGEFAAFEKGMKEVFTLMPGISDKAMGKMEDDVKDLAKEMGILPDDIVPALYDAISAGVPAENVFDFMEVASKTAIGGVTDLGVAVDGITSVVNAFGKENITAGEASDHMFTAVRLGKTTIEELSQSLFQVNPVAAGLGVNFGDVTAALAAMTAQGTPTRVASTQLRQALVELGKEGTIAFDHFKEATGQTFPEFIAGGGTVEEAFQEMKGKADDMGVGVGDLFGSVEAGMGVISLTSGSGAEAFGLAMDEMQTDSGATQSAFETMDEGLSRSWDKIKASVATAVLDIGKKLGPFVAQVADWMEKRLPAALDTAIEWFGKLADFVRDFVAGAGRIKDFFTNLPGPIGKVVVAIGLVVVALAALYAHPVIAGLALVAGAVALIGANARDTEGQVAGIKRDLETFSVISLDNLKGIFGEDDLRTMREAGLSLTDITTALTNTDLMAPQARLKVLDYLRTAGAGEGTLDAVGDAIFRVNTELGKQETEAASVEAELKQLGKRQGEQEDLQDKVALAAGRNSEAQRDAADVLHNEVGPALEDNIDDFELWEKSLTDAAASAELGVEAGVQGMIDIFSGAPDQIQTSVAEMIQNIKDQAKVAETFNEAMSQLAAAGLDAVVQQLADAGPAAADAAAKLANDMDSAFALELELDKLAGNALNEVQVALDGIDLNNIESVLSALTTKLGISEDAARRLAIKLGLLDGTSVHFSLTGTWNLPAPPAGFLPPEFTDIGSGVFIGHEGGTVPGPRGSEVAAILQAGETVVPLNGNTGGGDVNVYVEGNLFGAATVDDLVDMIENGRREYSLRNG